MNHTLKTNFVHSHSKNVKSSTITLANPSAYRDAESNMISSLHVSKFLLWGETQQLKIDEFSESPTFIFKVKLQKSSSSRLVVLLVLSNNSNRFFIKFGISFGFILKGSELMILTHFFEYESILSTSIPF